MRRTMSAGTFCSSLLCSTSDSLSAFFSSGGRAAALRRRRRGARCAMVFPIASKSSSTGGECSSFLNFGRRRFRGREERRFGGGLRKENTPTYNNTTTTHLQKRGFVLASSNGINNNNEQLKLFSEEGEGVDNTNNSNIRIHPLILKNLRTRLSIAEPTECQSAAIPLLAENLDVVIAAETGSGKTYSYAIPIVSNILKRKEIERREEVSALILCPNAHLCDQVKKAIDILTLPDDSEDDSEKKSIVRTVALTPDRGLPSSFPDIIVCTPARAEQDVFDWREGSWRKGAFTPYVKFIRTVVLDEADMLLGGGYARKVRNCFDVLFREEKLAATRGFYKTFEDESEINVKTTTGEWNNDLERDTEASMEQNWRKDHDFEEEEEEEDKEEDEDSDDDDENAQQHEYEYERKEQQKKKKKKPKARLGGKGKMGKGTNREFRRQYVFAAATVMSTGKRTPGAVLKFGFPDAVWTKSSSLHKPRAELTQTWREVSLETRAKALFDALDMDPKTAQVEKTLVFVNSGSVCEAISNELANFGAKAASFHSDIDPLERESRLRRFASQDIDVLVATDSVSRGVDIPNVKHVVQAEFAQNATEYLHRVGRTARAGKLGRATNILLPGDFDLANAIRKAELENRSVEDTFSRKRSFRNKFKKYGESRKRAA